MIRLQCDCGRQISAPEQWLGKRVKCPQCARPVLVRPADQADGTELPAERTDSAVKSVVSVAASSASENPAASSPYFGAAPAMATEPSAEPVAPSAEVLATVQDDASDASPGEPAPAAVHDSRLESESPAEAASPSVPAPTPAPPTPPRRLLAPAPPINALLNIPIPEEDDRAEYDPRGLPRFLGVLALLIGIASVAAYWSPNAKVWAVPAAGVAFALSAIAFSVGMSRHALGIRIPLLALILSSGMLGYLAWAKSHPPAGSLTSVHSPNADGDDTPEAKKSVRILTVASLRPAGKIEGTTVDLHFKLTNTSGRAISAVYGSLQIYDKDHTHRLEMLGLNVNQPLAPKASYESTTTWTLNDSRTPAALEDNRFTAEYRATTVLYADGSEDDFSQ